MSCLQFTEGQPQAPQCTPAPEQLLPNIIDGMSQARPLALYAMIPRSFTSYDAGYRKVTYRDLANAINGVAWFLSEHLKTSTSSETLAYVGPNDLGYVCYVLGAVKAGHTILLLSPRNTRDDHRSLFHTSKCQTLLTMPPPYSPTVATILESVQPSPRIIHVPTIFELLDGKYAHFPYPKSFASAKDEKLVIVHTSGTTGLPKVITYTHDFAAKYHTLQQIPAEPGYMNLACIASSQRAFMTFPFFHAGAMFICLLSAIPMQTVVITPLAGVPLSAQGIVDALKIVDVDSVLATAPFAEQIAKSEEMMKAITKHATAMTYGGGDVSDACANALMSRVILGGFNGSTETGTYPIVRPLEGWDAEDVKYIQPHRVANIHFMKTNGDNLFEAVIVRNSEEHLKQPVFTIFPELQEYRTKDLFSPHPRKEGLWVYRGRADDTIISATGENSNPVPMEQHVCLRPDVAAALMVGTGRYQKALIVEPVDADSISSPEQKERFIDSIWPTVEVANQKYPRVSHILRSHIMLTDPGLPLPRAGKGTVQRAPSLALYRDRINRLYDAFGDWENSDRVQQPYEVHLAMRS